MGICEDRQLDWELNAAIRTKPQPVHLVNNEPTGFSHWQVGMIQPDPNHTVDSHPHLDVIRERLRGRAKDENVTPEDREAARQALLVMYREKI
jgi:hypothetical protein